MGTLAVQELHRRIPVPALQGLPHRAPAKAKCDQAKGDGMSDNATLVALILVVLIGPSLADIAVECAQWIKRR